jgi:hypothetical protein
MPAGRRLADSQARASSKGPFRNDGVGAAAIAAAARIPASAIVFFYGDLDLAGSSGII